MELNAFEKVKEDFALLGTRLISLWLSMLWSQTAAKLDWKTLCLKSRDTFMSMAGEGWSQGYWWHFAVSNQPTWHAGGFRNVVQPSHNMLHFTYGFCHTSGLSIKTKNKHRTAAENGSPVLRFRPSTQSSVTYRVSWYYCTILFSIPTSQENESGEKHCLLIPGHGISCMRCYWVEVPVW